MEQSGLATEMSWIPAGEPTTGERFRFTIPTGHVMELFAEKGIVGNNCGTDGPDINPDPWPDGLKGIARPASTTACSTATTWTAPSSCSPRCWASASPKGHAGRRQELHDRRLPVLLEQGPRRGLHPPAGEGQVPPRLLRTARLGAGPACRRHPVPHQDLDRHRPDPPRHHPRRTIYFFDPSGNRNEVFSGGYIYYPDKPTITWYDESLGPAIFYHDRKLNETFLSVFT